MNKEIKELKQKLYLNIDTYNNELFELDNEIKNLKNKIHLYQKKIYEPIFKSAEYKNLINNFDKNPQKKVYDILLNFKKKQLYRYNINSGRLLKISKFDY